MDGVSEVEPRSPAQQYALAQDESQSAAAVAKTEREQQEYAELEQVHRAADLKAIEDANMTVHTSAWGQVCDFRGRPLHTLPLEQNRTPTHPVRLAPPTCLCSTVFCMTTETVKTL